MPAKVGLNQQSYPSMMTLNFINDQHTLVVTNSSLTRLKT